MYHFSPFEVVPANTVDPGSIVLLTRREAVATVALAVKLRDQRRAFLMLQPAPDDYAGAPGVFYDHLFGSVPALRVPHAKAVLPVSVHAATFQVRFDDVPPGGLSILDDGRLTVTGMFGAERSMAYALDDGSEHIPSPRQVWFPRWDIAAPDVSGKLQTLCTIQVSAGR